MGNIKIDQYVVGMVQTNCYVVANATTKECIVIDPGASGAKLAEKIRESGYIPKAVLLTHGHFDHAGAAETVAKEFDIQIYAHEAEKDTLENPQKNVGYMIGVKESYHADVYLRDRAELNIAGLHIQVIHTPGHTEGGCCYYLPEEAVLFSGDTLFAQSVGRTDFPGGSMSQLVRSIKEKLLILTEHVHATADDQEAKIQKTDADNDDIVNDITVYPGHNDITTIETERKYNPYL